MRKIIVSVFILLLSACASAPSTVEESYKKTKYTVDEYSKTKVIHGQYVSISFGIDGGGGIFLRKVNGEYQLYGTTFSQLGWCFFEKGIDKNAGNLPFTKVNSRVGSGTTNEDFYMSITEEQISTMEKRGVDVRIYGKNRTIDVALPAVYVQGFVKRANEIGN